VPAFHCFEHTAHHGGFADPRASDHGQETFGFILQKITDQLRFNKAILEIPWSNTRWWVDEFGA
jgi:hypothetical protein